MNLEYCVYRVNDDISFKKETPKGDKIELSITVKGKVYIEDGVIYPGTPDNPNEWEVTFHSFKYNGVELAGEDLEWYSLDEEIIENLDYEESENGKKLKLRDIDLTGFAEEILKDIKERSQNVVYRNGVYPKR